MNTRNRVNVLERRIARLKGEDGPAYVVLPCWPPPEGWQGPARRTKGYVGFRGPDEWDDPAGPERGTE